MQQWNWIAAGALVLLLCMIPINAQDKQELRPVAMVPYEGGPPDFEKDVLPILENKCTTCHSGSNKKGRLDLSSYEALLRGGKHGAAVVAGKPESSLLIQLSGKTQKPAMPPDDDEPLTPQELALLKAWVAQGAAGSSGSSPKTTTIKLTRIAERVQPVLALALTPDKKYLAVGRGPNISLHPTDATETVTRLVDEELKNLSQLDLVQALVFSRDGKQLYSGSFQEVIAWDTATGKIIRRYTGLADRAVALDISPDGQLLAVAGGAPTQEGEIVLFAVETGQEVLRLPAPHSDTVFGIRFSPDGKMLASAGADKFVKVWSVVPLPRPESTGQGLAYWMHQVMPWPSPAAAFLRFLQGEHQAREQDYSLLPAGTLLRSYEGHTHHVLDVAWRADGRTLVSAGADHTLKVWDYERGEQVRTIGGHSRQISRLAMLHNVPQVISACGDAGLRQWNIDNGGNVRNYPGATDFLHAVIAATDGSLVAAGGDDGTVRLYNGQNGQLIKTLK